MLIWVEGIIGAGKTTFCRELAGQFNFRNFEEPVEDNPYLEKFYLEPKRWAFPMQIDLLYRRYVTQKLAAYEAVGQNGYQGALVDRGMPGDRVFAQVHFDLGNLSFLEWVTYNRIYKTLACSLQPPSILIFLDVPAQLALERVRKRGRIVEETVTADYLERLRAGYMTMLDELRCGAHPWGRGVEVWHRDWSQAGDDQIRGALQACLDASGLGDHFKDHARRQ